MSSSEEAAPCPSNRNIAGIGGCLAIGTPLGVLSVNHPFQAPPSKAQGPCACAHQPHPGTPGAAIPGCVGYAGAA